LAVEDWAEIRRLARAEKMSISEIARVQGISRNTVKAALRCATRRRSMSASRAGRSWTRSSRASVSCSGVSDDAGDGDRGADRLEPLDPGLSSRVAELRPAYLPPDPSGRTSY
jgi:hypothetical protein